MKKVLLFSSMFFLLQNFIFAQKNINEIENISINVYQHQIDGIHPDVTNLLESKLRQIIVLNGISDFNFTNRFVITSKINVISKDIIVGPPQQISLKINITFFIGDIIENKIYGTTSIQSLGFGINETNAFVNAINTIKPDNEKFTTFVSTSKDKIAAYYNSNCVQIMKEAETLEAIQKFDAALYKLSMIPNICSECFANAQSAIIKTYQNMNNINGLKLYQQAKIDWYKSQNIEGANNAFSSIKKINFNSNCQDSVFSLINIISNKLKEDEKKDFELNLKKYNDELEENKKRYSQELEYRKLELLSAKEIALVFAKNQPKEIINYNIISKW